MSDTVSESTENTREDTSWNPSTRYDGLTPRRRGLILLILFVAASGLSFYFLMRDPLTEPHIYVAGLRDAGEAFDSRWSVRGPGPTLYVQSSLDELDRLNRSLHKDDEKSPATGRLSAAIQTQPGELLPQLATLSPSATDILILFLSAQGVNRRGEAMLSWNIDPPAGGNSWWAADDLLAALNKHPARLKLLVLEAGQTQWSPQDGILLNDFFTAFEEAVHDSHDPDLWAFVSHSTGQISYLDHRSRKPVFSAAVLEGLSGPADLNGNRFITIRELSQFTCMKVDDWSRRYAGYALRQTPRILNGGGSLDVSSDWPEIMRLPEDQESAAGPEPKPSESGPDSSQSEPSQQQTAGRPASARGRTVSTLTLLRRILAERIAGTTSVPSSANSSGIPAAMFFLQTPDPPETTPEPKVESGDVPQTTATAPDDSPQPAAAPNAAETPSVEPAPATAAPAEPKDEKLTPEEKLLADVWAIRDRLRSGNDLNWTAAECFPLEFRRLEHELVRLEFLARSPSQGLASDRERQMIRIQSRLEEMLAVLKNRIPMGVDAAALSRIVESQMLHSVAMRELFLPRDDPNLVRLKSLLETLPEILKTGNRTAAVSQLNALSEQDRTLMEFETVRRLASNARGVDDTLISQAAAHRIRLERIVAAAWRFHAWVADDLRSVDRSSLREEVMLTAAIPGTFGPATTERYRQLAVQLDRIERTLAIVGSAARLVSRFTSQLNDLVALARLTEDSEAGLAPTVGELSQMVRLVTKIEQTMRRSDSRELTQLEQSAAELRRRFESIQQRLSHSVDELADGTDAMKPGAGWRREVVLRLPLVDGPTRRRLWRSIEDRPIERVDAAASRTPTLGGLKSPPLSPAAWASLQAHILLQADVMGVPTDLTCDDPKELGDLLKRLDCARRDLRTIVRELDSADDGNTRLTLVGRSGDVLSRLYTSLAGAMHAELPLDPAALSRRQTLPRLRTWTAFSQLLSPTLTRRKYRTEPATLLHSLELRNALAWQADRLAGRQSQLEGDAVGNTLAAAGRYRQIIGMLWPGRPADVTSQQSLELSGPRDLALDRSQDRSVALECRNPSSRKLRLTPVADFDRTILDVQVNGTAAGPNASIEIDPETVARIEVRVRLLRNGESLSPIVIHGRVQAWNESSRTWEPFGSVRHTVSLRRPFTLSWVLSAGPGDFPAEVGGNGELILHPFPNRATGYQLQLRFLGTAPVTADVELVAVPPQVSLGLPHSAGDAILSQRGIKFAPDAAPVSLVWEPVSPQPPSPPTTPSNAPKQTPPQPVTADMAIKITDRGSSRTAWLPVTIEPQRPRKYLRPTVSYDPVRERVSVELRFRNGVILPKEPVRVSCRLVELPSTTEDSLAPVKVEAQLTAESVPVTVQAPLPSVVGRVVALAIDVDGVDRAFLYDIPCDRAVADVPERVDRNQIAILSPQTGAALASRGGPLNVKLQIDAPVAEAFRNTAVPLAEVWLDANGNHRLDAAESQVQLHSDRQVLLQLGSPDASGQFDVHADVRHWEIGLPRGGLSDGRVELRARLDSIQGTVFADPVEFVLDDEAPVLNAQGAEFAVLGAPFPIVVSAAKPDLSGIRSVQAQVDRDNDGRFSAESPAIRGAADETGRWTLQVPTAELPVGRYRVLIDARDAVGNRSEPIAVPMEILTQQQADLRRSQQTAPVAGLVVFGRDPIPDASVTLTPGAPAAQQTPPSGPGPVPGAAAAAKTPPFTAKTDADGRFRFDGVPIGAWTINVEVLLRNRPRTVQQGIQVAAPPAPAELHRIKLR